MQNKILNILKNFDIIGDIKDVAPYGEGHINRTFKVETTKEIYVLQQINDSIFKNVPALMRNISLVTDFIRGKIMERGGDVKREVLTVIKTIDGKDYYFDGEKYFRMYIFISDAVCYQQVKTAEDFYQVALAFGSFSNLLAEFDASLLYEVIPQFHDTRKRFENFMLSLNVDKFSRADGVKKEIDFVLARKDLVGKIADKIDTGEIPLKVTHNDTKLNNVLIDKLSGKSLCVIDLDTIMPGSILYDFGDSIRFGCNTALEDEKDLTKVNFDVELFEKFVDGYVQTQRESITEIEAQNLALSAIMMTFECGMRFLTDYLDGDIYFKTHREGHNLDRCRTQFKLVSEMELKLNELNTICKKYYEKYCK